MVDKTHHSKSTTSAQDEGAFVDAYEARLAGGSAGDVPAQWRVEIESMVRLHERVAVLPLPEVAPSVRAIVLGAAAQVVAERPVSLWARLSHWLLRPGPILVGATAAAVVFAVAVRPEKPAPQVDAGAVALLENSPPAAPPAEPETAAPAAAPAEVAPVPGPSQAPAEAQAQDKKSESAPLPAAAAAAVARAVPQATGKAIAAEPASVAPQAPADLAAASAEAKRAQAPQWNVDSDKAGPRREQESADEQVAKASRRPGPAPVMGAVGGQNIKSAEAVVDDSVQKDQAEVNQQFAKAPPAKPVQAQAQAQAQAQSQGRQAGYEQRAAKAEDNVKAPTADQATAGKDGGVAKLRAEIDRAADPAKRVALLQQLVALASQAGDGKTAAWAKEQLLIVSRSNSNNAGGSSRAKAAAESAPNQAAPVQKPAAEKSKSSSY